MIVTVFKSRIRPDVDPSWAEVSGQRMYELASAMPGFISYKEYAAADGEGVAVVEFRTAEELKAWREHYEHVEIQGRGRKELFDTYEIIIGEVTRRYRFNLETGRTDLSIDG
jgi:heme-degrading monooxygenase HmoA